MEFCDECGGMLVSEQNGEKSVTKCRNCGEVEEDVDEEGYKVTEEKDENPMNRLNVSSEEDDAATRPTTEKECPECGEETEHEWWMEQTRSSDEPATRFYECRECGNVHKEYD